MTQEMINTRRQWAYVHLMPTYSESEIANMDDNYLIDLTDDERKSDGC